MAWDIKKHIKDHWKKYVVGTVGGAFLLAASTFLPGYSEREEVERLLYGKQIDGKYFEVVMVGTEKSDSDYEGKYVKNAAFSPDFQVMRVMVPKSDGADGTADTASTDSFDRANANIEYILMDENMNWKVDPEDYVIDFTMKGGKDDSPAVWTSQSEFGKQMLKKNNRWYQQLKRDFLGKSRSRIGQYGDFLRDHFGL